MELIYLQRVTTDIPWGFRLYGGQDYAQPLSVMKVNAGSIASGNLLAGDVIISIGDEDAKGMSHAQALQEIKNAGHTLKLGIVRNRHQQQQADDGDDDLQIRNNQSEQPFSYDSFTDKLNIDDNKQQTGTTYNGYDVNNNNNATTDDNNNNTSNYNSYFNNSNNDINNNNANNDEVNLDDTKSPWNQSYQQIPQQPPQPPQQSQQQQQQYWNSPYTPQSPQQQQPQQQKIPDALLGLAAKGDNRKPFSYVADISDIQAQREKVKRRGMPNQSTIPKYQNILSMPHFEDSPKVRGPPKVFNPPQTHGSGQPPPQNPAAAGDAVVANLQFNSPLNLYSSDNVIETLKGQTGAEIKDVVGLPQKEKSDFKLSPVYKMIHGIDQPPPKPAILYAEASDAKARQQPQEEQRPEYPRPSHVSSAIPSRSFKILQNMTSGKNKPPSAALKQSLTDTEEEPERRFPKQPTGNFHFRDMNEPSQPRQDQQQQQQQQQPDNPNSFEPYYNRPKDQQPSSVGYPAPDHGYGTPDYSTPPSYSSPYSNVPQLYGGADRRGSFDRREGSSEVDTSSIYKYIKGTGPGDTNSKKIRYVGKSIPSKSFKFLQNMTGGPQDNDALPSQRRRHPHPHHQSSQSDIEPMDGYTISGSGRPYKPHPQHHYYEDSRVPINAKPQPPAEEPESTDF